MIKVIKKTGKIVNAYRLGERGKVVAGLIQEGKVIPLENGDYEIMSQEAVAGNSGHGELAKAEDYIKVDSSGNPYPINAAWFYENHRKIAENEYEQLPKPLDAWTVQEPMCEEIAYLIREKGLVLDDGNEERYFTAPLWGTMEAAAKDSILVFYSITYAEDGSVADADFNFVVRDEFERTYDIC